MKNSFSLLVTLLVCLAAHAQTRSTDSLYFVHLRDGSTLYSNKIELRNSFSQGKYLLLDNSRMVPLSQAKDFNGLQGAFAIGNIDDRYDVYKLETEGRRISLYSQCSYVTETVYTSPTLGGPANIPSTITTEAKAFYFSKNNGDIQRLTYNNLKLAVADDPASLHELRLAHTDLFLGIGLFAAGVTIMVADINHTIQRNNDAQNAYKAASDAWFNETRYNPNAPLPALPPHYGISALFYLGMATTLSAVIPLASIGKHTHKTLYIYNR